MKNLSNLTFAAKFENFTQHFHYSFIAIAFRSLDDKTINYLGTKHRAIYYKFGPKNCIKEFYSQLTEDQKILLNNYIMGLKYDLK